MGANRDGKTPGTLERDLAGDHFLGLDKSARNEFIEDFLHYIEGFEISRKHDFELITLFMDMSANSEDPPHILSKRTIQRAFTKADEIIGDIAKNHPSYLEEFPDADSEDDEDAKEEALQDFYADNDRWFRGLDEFDPRCILYAMRSIFTFLNPASPLRTGTLARDLASYHFPSIGRQLVVAEFLNYIDDSAINERYNRVLTDIFSDAMNAGNPYLACKRAIDEAIRLRPAGGVKEKPFHKTRPYQRDWERFEVKDTEDYFFEEWDVYDPRCVLETMRSIFAYLNPGSSVKAGTLEEDLAGDRYLSFDNIARQQLVTGFLAYIAPTAVNMGFNHVLSKIFLDAVSHGDPRLASPQVIDKMIHAQEDTEENAREGDEDLEGLNRAQDHVVQNLDQHNPRSVLAIMQSIFAFLNPDSPVKSSVLPAKNVAKKRAQKPMMKHYL